MTAERSGGGSRIGTTVAGLALAIPPMVAILAVGSVTHATLAATALTLAIAGVVVAPRAADGRRPAGASLAAFGFWLIAAVVLCQLIPLPMSWLRALSPRTAELWGGNDVLLRSSNPSLARHPLTLDPDGTAFAAVTALVVAVFFELASRFASVPRGRRLVSLAVVACIGTFEVVTLVHWLAGATTTYGMYALHFVERPNILIVTPLMNSNHAAALLSIGVPLMIGYALETKSPTAVGLLYVGAAVSGTMTLLTLSRGGIAVVAAETMAMAAVVLVRRVRRSGGQVLATSALAFAVACGIGAAAYVGLGRIAEQLGTLELSKLQVAARASRMVVDFPLGVGRGAFASTFAAYQEPRAGAPPALAAQFHFTHPENVALQLAVELGGFFALALLCVFCAALVMSLRRNAPRPLSMGALVGLIGLLAHDLVDFSMEFAGVALAAAALLAVVTTQGARKTPSQGRRQLRLAWLGAGALCMAGSVPVLLRAGWGRDDDIDMQRTAALWRSRAVVEAEREALAAMSRHPAEPYFPMVLGALRLRSAEAGPFFRRAAELGPWRPQTHFWFGRWFAAVGRYGQAWAEYRTAVQLDRSLGAFVLRDMILDKAPLADLESVAVTEELRDIASSMLTADGRETEAIAIDARTVEIYPDALTPRLCQINRLRTTAPVQALALAVVLVDRQPRDPRPYILLSELDVDAARREAALERGLALLGDDPALLSALIRLRGVRLGTAAIQTDLERFRAALASAGMPVHRASELEGDVLAERRDYGGAIKSYFAAAAASPSGIEDLDKAAKLAELQESWGLAEVAWRRLVDAQPDRPEHREGLARVLARRTNATGLPAQPPR